MAHNQQSILSQIARLESLEVKPSLSKVLSLLKNVVLWAARRFAEQQTEINKLNKKVAELQRE